MLKHRALAGGGRAFLTGASLGESATNAVAARDVSGVKEAGQAGLPGSRPAAGRLTVRLETSYSGLESLREEWDEAVSRLGGSIYFSFDWSKTWWDFYGENKELRILLFYAEGGLVGVLPIYIEHLGAGPASLRVARWVCANIPPKAFNAPVDASWAGAIFDALLAQLLARDGCDLLSFGPASDEHQTLSLLERSAERNKDGLVGEVVLKCKDVVSVFQLPATLEEYFQSMDKDERKKRKRELKVLSREASVRQDVVSQGEEVEAEFERFLRLHSAQWRGKGKLGHFGSWPRGQDFNRALVKALAPLGRVRLIRILAENQVISAVYAFCFGNCYYAELPARVMTEPWQRFSLGAAGFFALVDAATKEDVSRVEGGLMHYDYKRRLNAREYSTRTLRIIGKPWRARIRVLLFLLLRFFLWWGYYKLWYLRISPRLPESWRRPIWLFWLRLDF